MSSTNDWGGSQQDDSLLQRIQRCKRMSSTNDWGGSQPDPTPHFQRRVGQTRIQVFLDDEAYNEYLRVCGDIDCTFSDLVRACLEIGSPVLQRHPKAILPILGAEIDFIKRNRGP